MLLKHVMRRQSSERGGGVIRESLLTEVEFRLKPGMCEWLRHTDHLSLSPWSLSSGIISAMLSRKGSIEDKAVNSKPGS